MDKQMEKKSLKENLKNNWLAVSLAAGLVFLVAGLFAFLYVGWEKFSGRGFPWILIAVAVLLVLLGLAAVAMAIKKKEKQQPDYYVFFIMGLIWAGAGLPLDNSALWIMGLVFMVIGLANRDKWKDRRTWKDLSPGEKNLKMVAMVILGVLALAGLAAWYLVAR